MHFMKGPKQGLLCLIYWLKKIVTGSLLVDSQTTHFHVSQNPQIGLNYAIWDRLKNVAAWHVGAQLQLQRHSFDRAEWDHYICAHCRVNAETICAALVTMSSLKMRYWTRQYKKAKSLFTSRTMYQGRCIPGSILPSSRYAAKGFSSSHCKPGSTVKEDKEVHSGISSPKQNSILTLEKERPLKRRAWPFD